MKIEHIAIWVEDLETMKNFYQKYFDLQSSNKYENQNKAFSSYFLLFQSGARLELMKKEGITQNPTKNNLYFGFAHIAISAGNKQNVENLTTMIKNDGYKVISQPRTTGDGYYESVIEDPEGNLIEITE
jgi:lactoylglutathione lyase